MKVTGKIWVLYNSQSGKQTKPMSVVQTQVALLSLKTRNFKSIFIWTPGWDGWQPVEDFLKSEQTFFVIAQPPKPERPARTKSLAVDEEATQVTGTGTESGEKENHYTEVFAAEDHAVLKKEDYGYYYQDFNGHELDYSKIQKISKVKIKMTKTGKGSIDINNRRSTIRHGLKIEVVIITKERTFRTYSKNISLGGTLLEDEVPPDFLNKPFELIIINRFEADPGKRRLLFQAKIVGDIENPRRLMFLNAEPEMMARLDALLVAYVAYQQQMKKQAV